MSDEPTGLAEFDIGPLKQTGDFIWRLDSESILVLTREGVVGYGMNTVPPEGPGQSETYHVFVTLAGGGAVSHTFTSETQAHSCLEQIIQWRTRH